MTLTDFLTDVYATFTFTQAHAEAEPEQQEEEAETEDSESKPEGESEEGEEKEEEGQGGEEEEQEEEEEEEEEDEPEDLKPKLEEGVFPIPPNHYTYYTTEPHYHLIPFHTPPFSRSNPSLHTHLSSKFNPTNPPPNKTECSRSAQCAPLKHHFDACAARVAAQHENPDHKGPKEDCVEECRDFLFPPPLYTSTTSTKL